MLTPPTNGAKLLRIDVKGNVFSEERTHSAYSPAGGHLLTPLLAGPKVGHPRIRNWLARLGWLTTLHSSSRVSASEYGTARYGVPETGPGTLPFFIRSGEEKPMAQKVSRRAFLRMSGILAGTSVLAACVPATAPAPSAPAAAPACDPSPNRGPGRPGKPDHGGLVPHDRRCPAVDKGDHRQL